ncbi:T9SS type B sorting domain-containing protein [Flavobacterium sp.]|uniref:T9SS type B sorting domain-containing protein n=1 Tax=Flavobacterium sp. TaxID=239 RepID=UPI0039E5CE50
MRKIILLLAFLVSFAAKAQVYPMQNGTFSTCSGTFYDSGGAAGNYGAMETYQITFCPSTPGTYIQLNFTNFDVEGSPFDYMTIYNGSGTGGAVIGVYDDVNLPSCDVIASSHASGCLTVVFVSDGSLQYGGWAANIVCSNVPGGTPTSAPSNSVCAGADAFCADAGPLEFPNSSDGGCVPDAPTVVTNNTCLITAPNPAWYYLEVGVAGNINLEIEQTTGPNGTGTGLDVDYAIWGPFANSAAACADFTLGDCVGDHDCSGNVIDCSFSIDAIETATIPGAQVGQIYMVLITNFDGAPGYITMTQTNAGSPGAGSTDCSIVCPTFAGTNPTTCGATNGSITISGLDPNTNYTVTYLDDGTPTSVSVTSNAAGVAVINGLNAGNYTNIRTNYPGCTSTSGTVTLTAASAPVVSNISNNSPVCIGGNAVFTITGTPNATVGYNINGTGATTTVLSAAGTATVTVNGVSANTTINVVSVSVPGCNVPLVLSSMVTVNSVATITLTSAAATTNQTVCSNAPITAITYNVAGSGTGASASGLPTGVTANFVAGVLTISGTPTATGTFNYTVTTSGGCGVASLNGTITVNQAATIALTSAAGTTNQNICINTAINAITYAVANGATGATVTGLPAGITGSFAAGVFTISGTATASGTFNYTVTTTGGCGSDSETGTITIFGAATLTLTSAAATTNQTLCVNTPIANITYAAANGATGATASGLPTGVTGSFAAGIFTISGTPTVSGTFNYSVTTTGGCASDTENGTITVNPDVTLTLTSAAATTNQTVCGSTAIANITYAYGNGATGTTVLGLPTGVSGSAVAGVFTISGTPTASGTFNYTVTTTGGCASASLSGTIIVGANATIALTSAAATANQTVCINDPIATITYATTNASNVSATGLPAGVNVVYAAGVATISGTPTVSGTFNYTITTVGGCAVDSESGTLTINSDASLTQTSAIGTEVQTLCVSTAITPITYSVGGTASGATAIGLPAGVAAVYTAGVLTISGTPTATGTFNFTVTATGSGCSSPSLTGTITIDANATLALTSGIATDNQVLCIHTAIIPIAYSIANGGTGATVSGLPTGVTGSFSAGVFAISGTPTVDGTFNYTVTTTGGCSSASLNGTLTVTPEVTMTLTSAAGTNNQTVCTGTAITTITYGTANGVTNVTVSGLPTGVTGSFAAGIFTINGTPTVDGIFNYALTTVGGCSSVTLNGTITIDANGAMTLSSAPATTNQTLCINAALVPITYNTANGVTNVTVTGLPAGVTGNFAAGIFTISGSPTVDGIFNYAVTTSGGCTPVTLNGTITVSPAVTMVLSSALGTDNPTLCINTAIAAIAYTTTNGATNVTVSGLPTGVTGSFSAGIFTISGSPTVDGIFNYTVTTVGGCSSVTLNGTITVNPDVTMTLSSAAGTDNPTLCIGSAMTPITYATTNGATNVTVSGLPTGVTGSFAAGVFTINGTPSVDGIFNYTVTTVGGCSSVALNGTITVTPNVTMNLTSGIGTDNQTLCISTAIAPIDYTTTNGVTNVTVSGLPAGVTGSFAAGVFTISGTPTVDGTFNYTVTTVGGCSSVTLNGTITVNPGASLVQISAPGTETQGVCINNAIVPISYMIGSGATNATVSGLPAGVSGTFTAGVFSITGAPTVDGIFIFTVTATGSGCSSPTLSGSIIVNPDVTMVLTSAAATTSQNLCINTPIAPIIYTTTNGVANVTVSGLPSGVTANFTAGVLTISGTPTVAGTFNYTATTTGGCASVTLNGTITVNPDVTMVLTSASATTNQTLCINTAIAPIKYTTANGATNVTVSGLPTGVTGSFTAGVFTISGTATVSGIFNYAVTTAGDCSSVTLNGTITVNPNVTMTLTSSAATTNQTLCINTAIVPITYATANGVANATVVGLPTGVTGSFSAGTFTISGTPTVSGIFPYTVTTVGGCNSVILNGTLTVNPDVTIALTSAVGTDHQVLCIGTPIVPITYVTTNATNATVIGLPNGLTAVFAAGILTVSGSPTVSGEFNYTVTATGICVSASLVGSVSVNPNVALALTSASATTAQILCINTPISAITYLATNGATGATASGLPTGVSGNFAGGIFTISGTPTAAGVFPYTVTTTGGCSSVVLGGTITVNALATATINYAASPYCTTLNSAQAVTLTGTGPYTGGAFSAAAGLSLNATTGAINPSLSTAGNYTVTYLIPASGGCPAIPVLANVTITKAPTATISYSGAFCTSLTALQPVSLNGTSAYLGGIFSAPAGLSLNATSGAINPSLSTPGNYMVTYTIPASGGCAAVPTTTNVTINATPIAVANPAAQTICSEEATAISLSSAVAETTFTWTAVQTNVTGASDGSGDSIIQNLTATGNSVGTVRYTITPSTAFCTGTPIVVTITVNPLPIVSLSDGVICRNPTSGIAVRTYVLNAGLNNAAYDFVWTHDTYVIPGAVDNTYEADQAGVYTVYATNAATGCISYAATAVVTETEVAEIALIEGTEAFAQNPVIVVTVLGSGNYEYQIDNGAFQTSNVFANLNMGEHTLHVRDQDDCTDITQAFTLIDYPKFFTPNGDGYNDFWNIDALAGQQGSKISIFDRYGKLIKQISPSGQGWDGTYNGAMLPSTDYWFVVEYTDQQIKKEFKAHFSLKR